LRNCSLAWRSSIIMYENMNWKVVARRRRRRRRRRRGIDH
jgi:hypothetical protein